MKTAYEHNARERQRASVVAKLRGYVKFREGDTEEALKAQHLELTGEPYKTAEEEALAAHEANRAARDARYQESFDKAMSLISDAKANGFMDCRAVRDGLGFGQAKAKRRALQFYGGRLPLDRGRGREGLVSSARRGDVLHRRRQEDHSQSPTHRRIRRRLRAGQGVQREVVRRPSGQRGRDQCRSSWAMLTRPRLSKSD